MAKHGGYKQRQANSKMMDIHMMLAVDGWKPAVQTPLARSYDKQAVDRVSGVIAIYSVNIECDIRNHGKILEICICGPIIESDRYGNTRHSPMAVLKRYKIPAAFCSGYKKFIADEFAKYVKLCKQYNVR